MDLKEAVREGDQEKIIALLNAGADIRYVRPSGYTVMIDVMHGRPNQQSQNLIPLLRLLIDRGADLDAVSDHSESALSVAALIGRLDAIRLLLEAGANPDPLEWSSLHRAVAIGTLEEVRERIKLGDDLKVRDRWERTPWLLSIQTRDLAKAQFLLNAGADLNDRDRFSNTALILAIEANDPVMLRWLLDQGLDPNGTGECDDTVLIKAAESGGVECVRTLITAGADPNLSKESTTPIGSAANLEIARVIAQAGGDFAQVNEDVRDELTKRKRTDSIECSAEEYQVAKRRIFGNANPQPMNFPYWQAMVNHGRNAYRARSQFGYDDLRDGPIWCFDRFGKSFTELPDGRVIEIGGEHEDFYDPDFCIYNDVIVNRGDGTFEIYGYPEDVFPPTDFHTATLVRKAIYIIGNLGYLDRRQYGATQVYRLDIDTLVMEPVETTGEAPGWIHEHRARLVGNCIEVTGGEICNLVGAEEQFVENEERFVLDLGTRIWSKG